MSRVVVLVVAGVSGCLFILTPAGNNPQSLGEDVSSGGKDEQTLAHPYFTSIILRVDVSPPEVSL